MELREDCCGCFSIHRDDKQEGGGGVGTAVVSEERAEDPFRNGAEPVVRAYGVAVSRGR